MTFIGIRFKEPRFRKKVQCINVFLACFGILERGDSTVNLYIVSEWHNIRSYSIWEVIISTKSNRPRTLPCGIPLITILVSADLSR